MEAKIKDEVGDRSRSEVRTIAQLLYKADSSRVTGD